MIVNLAVEDRRIKIYGRQKVEKKKEQTTIWNKAKQLERKQQNKQSYKVY